LAELYTRFPSTILRQRFERARALSLEAQMRECVDYLQNPEVLIQEFVDAYTAIESCCDPEEQKFQAIAPGADVPGARALLLDRLFANGAVSVFDTVPFEFSCIARDVASMSGSTGNPCRTSTGSTTSDTWSTRSRSACSASCSTIRRPRRSRSSCA